MSSKKNIFLIGNKKKRTPKENKALKPIKKLGKELKLSDQNQKGIHGVKKTKLQQLLLVTSNKDNTSEIPSLTESNLEAKLQVKALNELETKNEFDYYVHQNVAKESKDKNSYTDINNFTKYFIDYNDIKNIFIDRLINDNGELEALRSALSNNTYINMEFLLLDLKYSPRNINIQKFCTEEVSNIYGYEQIIEETATKINASDNIGLKLMLPSQSDTKRLLKSKLRAQNFKTNLSELDNKGITEKAKIDAIFQNALESYIKQNNIKTGDNMSATEAFIEDATRKGDKFTTNLKTAVKDKEASSAILSLSKITDTNNSGFNFNQVWADFYSISNDVKTTSFISMLQTVLSGTAGVGGVALMLGQIPTMINYLLRFVKLFFQALITYYISVPEVYNFLSEVIGQNVIVPITTLVTKYTFGFILSDHLLQKLNNLIASTINSIVVIVSLVIYLVMPILTLLACFFWFLNTSLGSFFVSAFTSLLAGITTIEQSTLGTNYSEKLGKSLEKAEKYSNIFNTGATYFEKDSWTIAGDWTLMNKQCRDVDYYNLNEKECKELVELAQNNFNRLAQIENDQEKKFSNFTQLQSKIPLFGRQISTRDNNPLEKIHKHKVKEELPATFEKYYYDNVIMNTKTYEITKPIKERLVSYFRGIRAKIEYNEDIADGFFSKVLSFIKALFNGIWNYLFGTKTEISKGDFIKLKQSISEDLTEQQMFKILVAIKKDIELIDTQPVTTELALNKKIYQYIGVFINDMFEIKKDIIEVPQKKLLAMDKDLQELQILNDYFVNKSDIDIKDVYNLLIKKYSNINGLIKLQSPKILINIDGLDAIDLNAPDLPKILESQAKANFRNKPQINTLLTIINRINQNTSRITTITNEISHLNIEAYKSSINSIKEIFKRDIKGFFNPIAKASLFEFAQISPGLLFDQCKVWQKANVVWYWTIDCDSSFDLKDINIDVLKSYLIKINASKVDFKDNKILKEYGLSELFINNDLLSQFRDFYGYLWDTNEINVNELATNPIFLLCDFNILDDIQNFLSYDLNNRYKEMKEKSKNYKHDKKFIIQNN